MYLAKAALLKASRPENPSVSFRSLPTRKVSRVCFASAANHPEGRNAADEMRESGFKYMADRANRSTREAGDNTLGMTDRAKETIYGGMDKAKEYANEMKETASGIAGSAVEGGKEGTERTTGTAQDMTNKLRDASGSMVDKAKEGANQAAGSTEEVTNKAGDNLGSMADKARQTMQGAWEAAKETTQKIRESFVGKGDNEAGERTMDERLEDLNKGG